MFDVESEGSVIGESPSRRRGQQLCGGGRLWKQVVVGGQRDIRCRDHLT